MPKPKPFPGCIYLNKSRYWWRVRLPGEEKIRSRPLCPDGSKFATTDLETAQVIAGDLYERAVFSAGPGGSFDGSLASLIQRYTAHAESYYRGPDGNPSDEVRKIRSACELLLAQCPRMSASDFGPKVLKSVRDTLVDGTWQEPKRQLKRITINQRVSIIQRMFKWAASEQLVPASVWHGVNSVQPIPKGRGGALEGKTVGPISDRWVRLTMKAMPPTLAAMVELQMTTGMRSGELVIMRPCDIDMTGRIWLYRPAWHKEKFRGHDRIVPLGPKAKKIVSQFLDRPTESYLFSSMECQQERLAAKREAAKSPSKQDRRKADPKKRPGHRYTSASYRRAVTYAIALARETIDKRIPDWHPHQLRHTAATMIRKEKGLDAARAVLGHRSLGIADTYAEIDQDLATRVAASMG